MTPQQLPKPGDVVGGKYRIERTVGHGGMSVVFEVSHRITDKRFAVKWMLPEDSGDADMVKRFVREAKVAGRCQHPNIVEVYDIDQDGGAFFIVMELLEGESLARRLERVGRLTVGEACRLLIPCMEGLGVAHAAGIVHRDLKPANIFVCAARGRQPERAMLLDFGVSQFTTLPGAISATHTKRGAVLGTPFYMPVEQLRGQRVDHRIDVYALGVTLFEALSGQRPFQAERYVDLVIKIAEQEPTRLESLVPGVPRGIVEIISRAMAREAVDRYSTVAEMIAALQPYQHGFDDVATLSGTPAQAWVSSPAAQTPLASESLARRWAASGSSTRRWRWLAVTVLGLLLVALALVGSRRRRESADDRAAQPSAATKPRVERSGAEREGAQGSAAQSPAEPLRDGRAPLPPSAAASPASAPSGNTSPGSAPPGTASSSNVQPRDAPPGNAASGSVLPGNAPPGSAPTEAVPTIAVPPSAAPSTPAPMPPPAASAQHPAPAASSGRSPAQGSARKPNEPANPGHAANPSKGSPKQPAPQGEAPSPAPSADVTTSPADDGEPTSHRATGPTPVPLDRSEF